MSKTYDGQIRKLDSVSPWFDGLKNRPKNIFYAGNTEFLNSRKISIVGTRNPNQYTKSFTLSISKTLSQNGFIVVSGAALGVDTIAHEGSFPNTIAVLANSLEYFYPAFNENLLRKIYQNSLAISEYEQNFTATKYSFVARNRLVVTLGEALIVTQADLDSGSMRSVEFAIKENKPIFVFPHRIGESEGTNYLLKNNLAKPIFDINEFVESLIGKKINDKQDEVIKFCNDGVSIEDFVKKYGLLLYEYEFDGKIILKNGRVYPA